MKELRKILKIWLKVIAIMAFWLIVLAAMVGIVAWMLKERQFAMLTMFWFLFMTGLPTTIIYLMEGRGR